jgi:uncharacterized protein YkwD
MCLKDSDNFKKGFMSVETIESVVDRHNEERRSVIPAAANMQKVYWDVKLQQLAQKRAQLCLAESTNFILKKRIEFGMLIGENIATNANSWDEVLDLWINEKKLYVHANANSTLQSKHYLQV